MKRFVSLFSRLGISPTRKWLLAAPLGVLMVMLAGLGGDSTSVQGQATRTWVSGVGDDANPCSRTAPCKTFAGAISKTQAGGEINCLDPGGFGGLTITKSISVICDYTEGGVLVSGTNAFIINAPANSIVTLKGLDIECLGTGLNGISMTGVGVTLHVHKVQVRNCRGTNGNGIKIANSSGLAKVVVADSYITDNGFSVNEAGILVRPTGGASANVTVNRVQLENNTNGIFGDGGGGSGPSNITVNDSFITSNSNNGVAINSTATTFGGMVIGTAIHFNGNTGVRVFGSFANLSLGSSSLKGNGTGVAAVSSGVLTSFKNNQISANGIDGTPITAVNSGGLILN